MPKQRSAQDNNDMSDLDQEAQAPESALEEGKVFDYITGKPVKDSDKEKVRQHIERALIHEYGIAAEDMEPDFKVKVLGKNRKLDIAIFKPGVDRAHAWALDSHALHRRRPLPCSDCPFGGSVSG